jgi:hypothetical protein
MAATPKTDRKKIRGNINTYFKETRFDLSDEGHNRMVMEGGYGVGSTDEDGNIMEPLASLLRHWELDPDNFKEDPAGTRVALQEAKRRLGPGRGYAHYDKVPNEQLTDAFHYCFRTSRCRSGPTAFTFCGRGPIPPIRNGASSTTGGTPASPRARRSS